MKKKALSQRITSLRVEHCASPLNGECRNTDVALYILYKGNRLPICRSCWNEIADKDFEWGEDHVF